VRLDNDAMTADQESQIGKPIHMYQGEEAEDSHVSYLRLVSLAALATFSDSRSLSVRRRSLSASHEGQNASPARKALTFGPMWLCEVAFFFFLPLFPAALLDDRGVDSVSSSVLKF
jgi:hypothetical protein